MSKDLYLLIDEKKKDKVRKDVEEMCSRLLINPVIHKSHITIREIPNTH
jgi:phosphoribosylformylglycinamidine synthase PurS subunit